MPYIPVPVDIEPFGEQFHERFDDLQLYLDQNFGSMTHRAVQTPREGDQGWEQNCCDKCDDLERQIKILVTSAVFTVPNPTPLSGKTTFLTDLNARLADLWGQAGVASNPPSVVPNHVVGGYWPKYQADTSLADIDPKYNIVWLFQAGPVGGQPGTDGSIAWADDGGDTWGAAYYHDAVQALRAAGTTVIFTIGGGGAYIKLDTLEKTNNCLASIYDIIDNQLGGVDGLDFNLETTAGHYWNTATSGTSTTLTVTGAGWTTDEFVDQIIKITVGTGIGQQGLITSNTADTVTFDTTWATSADSTSEFAITYKVYPDNMVYMAKELRKKYGSNFILTIPVSGSSWSGGFIQHDYDIVTALENNVDFAGRSLMDLVIPQFYDLWEDAPTTTMLARVQYIYGRISAWAPYVNNDWKKLGIGFLSVGGDGSKVSVPACALAYELVVAEHHDLRGAFHFDLNTDHGQDWLFVNTLAPIINNATGLVDPNIKLAAIADSFNSLDTGKWTAVGTPSFTGGSMILSPTDYGDIQGVISNNVHYSLEDGHIELFIQSIPAGTSGGALFDWGMYNTDPTKYFVFRWYIDDVAQGYELHYGDGTNTYVAYLDTPIDSTVFRIVLIDSYVVVYKAIAPGYPYVRIGLEEVALCPALLDGQVVIKAQGLETGSWTINGING